MATDDPIKKSGILDMSKGKQLEWRRKLMVFSFFLAIAAVIWLLNALSKDYTAEIKYPITYSKFPPNKMLVNEVPDHLGLKVNAHGYALLSYKLTNRPIPLSFPVSNFTMNRMAGDTTKFYLLTRYTRERLARQLPGDLQLLEVFPDTLVFQFATEVSRMVQVKPDLEFTMGRGFVMKDDILISPESILVTGPDIYLDTLRYLRTKKKVPGTLTKSYNDVLEIAVPHRLRFQVHEVNCKIELEKLTEVQVMVPVRINGLPDSLRMQTFPQQVRVTGNIGLSEYDRIVPDAFWIEVDYHEVMDNPDRLQVYMRSKPEELRGGDFYPKYVEYLLSVK
ncbi:MAG: hypothetical protein WD052_02520 [Bacteroidales bacterium]